MKKCRKFLATILSVCLLLSVVPVTSLAESVENNDGKDSIVSPDGSLKVNFWLDDAGTPLYEVIRNETDVLVQPSSLGMTMAEKDGGAFTTGLTLTDTVKDSVRTSWEPAVQWTKAEIPDNYEQATLKLAEAAGTRKLDITFRVYDEGFGFRYTFPEEDNSLTSFEIVNEETRIAIPAGTQALYLGTHAQAIPSQNAVEKMTGSHYTPMTLTYASGTCGSIFESDLIDYARLKLDSVNGVMKSNVKWGSNIKGTAPFNTPWRGMIVGDSVGELQERNYLVQNLSTPCQIEDTSWIKPGGLIREAQLTLPNTKDCVDFAAENNIPYIMYDSGWYGSEDGSKVDPKVPFLGEFPYFENNPGLGMRRCDVDVRDGIAYGKEKGVGVILYVNHIHLEKYDLDELFKTYKEWGVAGVKFGFVNVGSQRWTKWLTDAIATAAKYDLIVKVHDEYTPSGYERTYPNLFNVEGVLGDEGSPNYTADLKQVFTRTMVGPTDHTFCYPVAQYRGAIKTNAFSLAAPILYYAPAPSLFWYGKPADHVGNPYPEIKFWKDMPTVWDDSKHIDSSIGQYFTMARRSGDEWFVGSISAIARDMSLALDFLTPDVKYVAEIYANSPGDTLQKNKVACHKFLVDSETVWTEQMIVGGGLSMRLVPATEDEINTIPAPEKYLLMQAIQAAEAIDLSLYTTKSVKESGLADAITAAQAVVEDSQATADMINEAIAAIDTAKALLVSKILLFEKVPQSAFVLSASDERLGTHEAKFANDGNLNSLWHTSADKNPPFDLFIDLQTPKAVSKFEITGRNSSSLNGFPLVFDVLCSDDGINYTKIKSIDWKGYSPTKGGVKPVEFDSVTARYFKLHFTDSWVSGSHYKPVAIAEFNVFANPLKPLEDLIETAKAALAGLTDEAQKAALSDAIDVAVDYLETATDSENLAAEMAKLQYLVDRINPMITVGDINNLDGAQGTEFSLPVKVIGFPKEGSKSIEGIINIPEGVEVKTINAPAMTNVTFDSHVDGNKLRFAFIATGADMIQFADYNLLTLNLALSETHDFESSFQIAFDRFTAKDSANSADFDVSDAVSTVTIAARPVTALATELYVSDGMDVIPTGKKAVSVIFTGIEDTADVKFGEVQFYFSPQRSAVNDQKVYVALIDEAVKLEDLNVPENYTIADTGVQFAEFGDINEDGDINATDALAVITAWLRKDEAPSEKKMLLMNVSADGRIDTTDAIAIVDNYVDESKEFAVVVK